jgi:hypothetical protein
MRSRPLVLSVLAALVLAAAAAAPAAAQNGDPFAPLPPAQDDPPVVVPTVADEDEGLQSWQQTLLIVGGVLFVVAIGVAIARDARRHAPDDRGRARRGPRGRGLRGRAGLGRGARPGQRHAAGPAPGTREGAHRAGVAQEEPLSKDRPLQDAVPARRWAARRTQSWRGRIGLGACWPSTGLPERVRSSDRRSGRARGEAARGAGSCGSTCA